MDTTIENSIVCEAKSKTGKTSNLLAKRKLKKKKDPEHIVSIYRIYTNLISFIKYLLLYHFFFINFVNTD